MSQTKLNKLKFFESKLLSVGQADKNQQGAQKTLNSLTIQRMIYLDFFFFFLGVNIDESGAPASQVDSNQYLFWMKDMVVKS